MGAGGKETYERNEASACTQGGDELTITAHTTRQSTIHEQCTHLQFPVHALETVPGTDPYRPAGQGPEHAGEGSPEVAPYVPAGHGVHDPEPAREYEPKGHAVALGDVDPGPHTYPALQLPEQTLLGRATTAPKVPAGHGLQAVAPLRLYFPRGHCTANGDVLPPGHAYPALQVVCEGGGYGGGRKRDR